MSPSPSPEVRVFNLAQGFGRLAKPWNPGIAGQVNDMHVKLARLEGEFLWHTHAAEDEMFLVHAGHMVMHLRDRALPVGPGEFVIIPAGVEHKPEAPQFAEVVLFEPAGTLNTGDAGGERTVTPDWL
jgi:mannose-6-phosphate isomerase-like protein (cupin superfamily)